LTQTWLKDKDENGGDDLQLGLMRSLATLEQQT
jgi:hypothetical protein